MLEKHSIVYGKTKIDFLLDRRQRKTLAIHVHPDMRIEVVAPIDATVEQIAEKVRKRAAWILQQIKYFEQFYPKTPERTYVAGETHRYLGRQYRLRTHEGKEPEVKLVRGFIIVQTQNPKDSSRIRALVETWLFERAKLKFQERIEICLRLFPNPEVVRPTGLIVRTMSRRWGSMTPSGRIVLNRRLIQAPIQCIDYVIVHELCHRIHSSHNADFWRLLSRVLPSWEEKKLRLEQIMA